MKRGGISRRAFLAGAGGAAVGGGLLAAAACGDGQEADGGAPGARFVPFAGPHQAGITLEPAPATGLMASFTVLARDRAELAELLRELTDEIAGLMEGRPPETRDPAFPPTDSGLLGPNPAPDDLAVVVSVGASLFDERYGLAPRRPRELVTMPFVSNDRLDPERSHGDLLLSIEAEHPDTVLFALRQLMRRTRSTLVLRWVLDGFTRRGSTAARSTGSPRNLMGFIDGTANLDAGAGTTMDRYVWVAGGDGEPSWAVGGSYHVVRVIRMLVEFWDRTPLSEQEHIMGREKVSGAPLGMEHETDVPDYAADPKGAAIPLDAHIRLANPRTPETAGSLILRRGFSYARGYDRAGRLDQGLAFVCYQRSLETGFMAVQARLNGEPLEEYILPEGGGFFFALPGAEPGTFLGQALVA
ncbi:MAG TPA: iron uptake transporter deferrochelatase/peroxidase subunit [Miltoncostaeaceae bacterium]|nr:iron uptake transporter deferrochelatase/peroxidase subunit [Miltoncostaeaceae bacterium]